MSRNPIPPEPGVLDPATLEAQRARMRRLARSLVRDYDAADDVVQETCLRALTGSVKPRRSVGACLAGVVRNVASRLHRSEGRREKRERDAARRDGAPSTLDLLARVEEQQRVLACVRRLAEPYRTAILLRYFEGLPPRAIAAQTGAPLDTVKSRLKRGLQKLRSQMDTEHGGSRRAWMAVLLPVAGFGMVKTASALTTGGTIVATTTTKTKTITAATALMLFGGAALIYGGVFEDDKHVTSEPELMTATAPAPELAGAGTKKPREELSADKAGDAADARDEVNTAKQPEAQPPKTGASQAAGTKRKKKAAVHRSPFGLPKRRGSGRIRGGGGGGMAGPTGHWTRFGMARKPEGRARIAVAVKDKDGKPIEGAEVYLGPPDTAGVNGISFGDLRKLGPTKAGGALQADGLPEGEAAVFARFHSRLLTPGGLDGRHGKTTTLNGGQTARVEVTLPFALAELGSVKGRVLGPDGALLKGAEIASGFGHFWAKDGTYELHGLPVGPRSVAANRTGYGRTSVETEVVAGKSVTADIRMDYEEAGTVRLEGRVTGPDGEPVPKANVYLMIEKDRGTNRYVRTDENGRYVMDRLPERVRSEKLRLQAGRIPLYNAKVITFESGIRTPEVNLQLPVRYVQLQLRILDAETEKPIRELRVRAHRPESTRPTMSVGYDYDKGYRKGMVEAGRHRITIDALDHEDVELDLDIQPDADWTFSHEIKLKRVSPPSVEVALTVRVKEAGTGNAVPRVRIEILETTTGEALSRFDGERIDGEFRMPGLSGSRKLVIRADGYRDYSTSLTLKPDVTEVELDVELQPK